MKCICIKPMSLDSLLFAQESKSPVNLAVDVLCAPVRPRWPSAFGESILAVRSWLTANRAGRSDNDSTAAAASVRGIPLTTWCSLSQTFPRHSSNLSIQPVFTTMMPIKTAAATLVSLPLDHTRWVICSPNDFETFTPSDFNFFAYTPEISLETWIEEIQVQLHGWNHIIEYEYRGKTNFPLLSAVSMKATISREGHLALSEFLKEWNGILKTVEINLHGHHDASCRKGLYSSAI